MKKTKWLQRAYCALLGAVLALTPMLFGCDNGSSGGGEDKTPTLQKVIDDAITAGNTTLSLKDIAYKASDAEIRSAFRLSDVKLSGKTLTIDVGETDVVSLQNITGGNVIVKGGKVTFGEGCAVAASVAGRAILSGSIPVLSVEKDAELSLEKATVGVLDINGAAIVESDADSSVTDVNVKASGAALEVNATNLTVESGVESVNLAGGSIDTLVDKSGSENAVVSITGNLKLENASGVKYETASGVEVKNEAGNTPEGAIVYEIGDVFIEVSATAPTTLSIFASEIPFEGLSVKTTYTDSNLSPKLVELTADNTMTTYTIENGKLVYEILYGGEPLTLEDGTDYTLTLSDTDKVAPFGDDAYEDADLVVTFDAAPTINKDSGKVVKIYDEDENLVDTIAPKAEKIKSIVSKAAADVLVDDQLIWVDGNSLKIKLHSADSAKASKLANGKEYCVVIEDGLITGNVSEKEFKGVNPYMWTFATRTAPTISGKTITVGKTGTENFSTVQGAFNYLMTTNATDDWTINIGEGDYNERLGYFGEANVTMIGANTGTIDDKVGKDGTAYVEKTIIHWKNMNGADKSGYAWNPSSRGRAAFLWEGGNLTLENLTFANKIDRAVVGKNGTQAEAFYYDAVGYLVANNCAFKSHQDTLLLGNTGGRAWFYKCYIEGDTDFIWGYIDVALFEECEIRCLYDSAPDVTTHTSYIFASRTPQAHNCNKGFVLFNSNITVEENVKAYYGRNSGSDTQATVVFNTFKGVKVDEKLWESGATQFDIDVSGIAAIGYKDYGNKFFNGTSGEEISTAKRLEGTYTLSREVAEREYCGRNAILNRGWDVNSKVYVPCETQWNLSSLETKYSASADASKKMIYIEPTYVPYLAKDATQDFVATDYKGTTVSPTYVSKDTTFATVSGSTVTAIEKVDGENNKLSGFVTIEATAAGDMKGEAVIYVIPAVIPATGITLDWGDSKTIEVGDITTITATIAPNDVTDKSITWTSSDTNVVRVEGSGPRKDGLTATVTGFGKGEATLTATVTKTNSVLATCTVTVKDVYFASYLSNGAYTPNASVAHRDATIAASPVTYGFAGTTVKTDELIAWGNGGWNISSSAAVDGQQGADFFWAEFPIRAAGAITLKSASVDLYTSATGNTRAMMYVKVGNGAYTSCIKDGIASTDKAMSLRKQKFSDTGIEVAAGQTATVKIAIASKADKTLAKAVKCAIGDVVIYYEPKGDPIDFPGADGEYNILDYHNGGTGQNDPIADGEAVDKMVSWTGMKYHSAGYGAYTGDGTISIKVGGPSVIGILGSEYGGGTLTVTDSTNKVIAGPASTKMESDKSEATRWLYFLYTESVPDTIKLTFSGTSYVGKITVKELTSEKAEVTEIKVNGVAEVSTLAPSKFTASVKATYCGTADVNWSSSDETIATVAADGTVTGLKGGTVTITATSKLDATKSDSVEVTIVAVELKPKVDVTYVYNFLADNKNKTPASTGVEVADVEVTTSVAGSSSDTFLSWNNKWKSHSYGIQTDVGASLSLKVAGKCVIGWCGSAQYKGTLNVTYGDSDTPLLTGISSAGTGEKTGYVWFIYDKTEPTTVKISRADGTSYFTELTVKPWTNEEPAVTSVNVNGKKKLAVADGTSTYTAEVVGEYFPSQVVTWTVENGTGTATIDENGVLTIGTVGTVTVKATSKIDTSKVGSLEVTISDASNEPEVAKIYEYPLKSNSTMPYNSDDTFLTVNATGGNQSSGHGSHLSVNDTVVLKVAGASTIYFESCSYGADSTVEVYASDDTKLGEFTFAKNTSSNDAEVQKSSFNYEGAADTLTFKVTAGGNTYLHSLKVVPVQNYLLKSNSTMPYNSDDGALTVNATGGNQSSGHGSHLSVNDTVVLKVAGASTIYFESCSYGADSTVEVYASDDTKVGEFTFAKNTSSNDAEVQKSSFNYEGAADTLTFKVTTGGNTYLHSLSVDY